MKTLVIFLVGLAVVQGLNIPVEIKEREIEVLSQSGNNIKVVDKSGLFVGTVSVGTPLQDINVVFDTNSGLLWVPSSKCACARECSFTSVCYDTCSSHCCAAPTSNKPEKPDTEEPEKPTPEDLEFLEVDGFCTNKNAFNVEKSTSFKSSDRTVEQIINNQTITIAIGSDRFRLGPHHRTGLNAHKLQFGTVEKFPSGYEDLLYDGVFGLARSGPAGLKSPAKQILDQNSQISIVTIYTYKNYKNNKASGIITLGQINNELCRYNVSNMAPLLNRVDWTFRVFNVVFSQTHQSDLKWTATININSPYLTVPEKILQRILGQTHAKFDNVTGEYIVNYNEGVKALHGSSITIGKTNWGLDREALLTKISNGNAILLLRGSNDNKWILGRPFIINRCTFLDYSRRIGFGQVFNEH